MPLDRRIVVHIEELGSYDDAGVYHAGPVTDYRVWCQEDDGGSQQVETPGGDYLLQRKTWLVRYNRIFALAFTAFMSVTDANGRNFEVQEIEVNTDQQLRRRLILIAGVEVLTAAQTAQLGG